MPREYADRAKRVRLAFDKFLAEMGVLKKKRKELTERIIKRIEKEKIDEIMKSI